ncbi:hypothetical protein [Castellaniella sp.]|uniref:hypothetical protein n=1 Tax=Castellaniella sp. TaxID=1955812 RepID=UPI002B0005E9|nr:hypothetical protein [Castellaniella sp.]
MIKYKDIPGQYTVDKFLAMHFGEDEARRKLGGLDRKIDYTKKIAYDHEAIHREIFQFYERVGAQLWRSRADALALYGASLYYNPDSPQSEWHRETFGAPRYREMTNEQYFGAPCAERAAGKPKSDYVDQFAFRRRHPYIESHLPTLNALFDSFNFPIARVASRTLNGLCQIGNGWHVDSADSYVLQLNLCINNNGMFGLEYKTGELFIPESGELCIVNTSFLHSTYCQQRCNYQRTALVINILPWYHYDPTEDGWEPNEYFGKIHPFDMVTQGIIRFGD